MTSKRILILEDDPVLNNIYAKAIKSGGYLVDTAQTLDAARILISDHTYDVFLCDVRIGKQHGTDLLAEYKEYFALHGTHIIVASAFGNYRYESAVLDTEMFLEKPISLNTLIALIAQLTDENGEEENKPVPS